MSGKKLRKAASSYSAISAANLNVARDRIEPLTPAFSGILP
jgi:hypothetical protein